MSRIREGTLIADKYRLERPLARGGMGAIWVARHTQLDMLVAVKFMDAAFAATAEGRSRFEREAKAVALIQSPNIIHIHDYGIHDELPYMAMELLRGEDLGARIRRDGRLPVAFVAEVVTQTCKALRKAHDAGIIHRDLKPANIFLARDDDEQIVKVLDFGVAKVLGTGEATEATRTGVVIGSVHYMSPEQARGLKDLDHRADLWSLGVIAFRALTGQLPFPGDQMGDVIVKICSDPLPVITEFRPELGPAADAFFERAFARKPKDRFESARELARAFAALAGREPSSAALSMREPLPSTATEVSGPPKGMLLKYSPDAVTLSGIVPPAPVSATPLAMGSAPSDAPPMPPIFPAPAMSTTLTAASQVSEIVPGVPSRPGKKKLVVLGAVCATVLALGGAIAFTRGSEPARAMNAAALGSAPAQAAPPIAATTTAAPAPADTASAAEAPAAEAPAASAATAPPARSTAPSAKKPAAKARKINSELGF